MASINSGTGKSIKIFQIDAFTDKPFGGNPAGVAFGDNLSKEDMQSIAREMNLAETAFLSPPSDTLAMEGKADYNLRWFTPTMEVDLCGHATIASLHFLNENGLLKNNSVIKFDTLSGILKCRIENGKYFMQIPLYKLIEYSEQKPDILESLGLTENALDPAVPFIMLENGYLYIYVKKLSTLRELKPNFKELLRLQLQLNFGGAVVFTLETIDKGSFAHLRFFAPFFGIDEDPVTGSANGPLITVLNKLSFIKIGNEEINLTFEQGDIINRRGRVGVKFIPAINELYISGNAVTVLKGEMFH